jgi:hypothetical protein
LKTAARVVALDAVDGEHEIPENALRRTVLWLEDVTHRHERAAQAE